MAESNLNRIIKTGDTPTPSGYVRPTGVPDGESIIANAPVIENGGVNYYPIYYMCLMDTVASESFTKTGNGVSSGADAYVFSDEPSTLYVGDTTHTFDVADDYITSEGWGCRYVIAYATEANKDASNGINVGIYSYKTIFEFIGGQYLKFTSYSAITGGSSSVTTSIKYINISNSTFKDNTIAAGTFCYNNYALQEILFPAVTSITSSTSFMGKCYSINKVDLPVLTDTSINFLQDTYSLKYFKIPSTITTMPYTNANTLNYTQFIELPDDFDIDACNFTGATGYNKSLAWFTHLATQLKDNSSGTAKTMTLGAANIALIPSAQATIISNKNWTIN